MKVCSSYSVTKREISTVCQSPYSERDLDIDTLHDTITGRISYGQTTAMLVEALQLADFESTTVYIIFDTYQQAQHMLHRFVAIAKQMGYSVEVRSQSMIIVDGRKIYAFRSVDREVFVTSTHILIDHMVPC